MSRRSGRKSDPSIDGYTVPVVGAQIQQMTTNDETGSAQAGDTTNASPSHGTLEIVTASGTHVGHVRSVNQDAFGEFEDPERGIRLLVIADGMGGHRGGEVASRLAIERIGEVFEAPADNHEDMLRAAFEGANTRIFDTSTGDPDLAGMGTTGVAALFDGGQTVFVAHVGDSRAYRLRGDVFEQVTDDNSLVGELVRRGQLTSEEARVHPQSNEILRALGTQPQVEVEMTPVDALVGDRFLLCSDGLSGMLPDPSIALILASEAPNEAITQLIYMANEAGGTDNITVQIVEFPASRREPTTSGDSGGAQASSSEPHPANASASLGQAAAAGSPLRWAMLVVFAAALAWLFFAGSDAPS
jgi:serine/threonine protein phosphatase PrpC